MGYVTGVLIFFVYFYFVDRSQKDNFFRNNDSHLIVIKVTIRGKINQ